MKLTDKQRDILNRELHENGSERFVILVDHADDQIAKNLSNKGLGYFTDHRYLYTWRKRNGYNNIFILNDAGMAPRTNKP